MVITNNWQLSNASLYLKEKFHFCGNKLKKKKKKLANAKLTTTLLGCSGWHYYVVVLFYGNLHTIL